MNNGKKLYVGNIPYDTTDADLTAHFATIGPCKASIIRDRTTQRSRGFGFVEYPGFEDAAAAVTQLHQVKFQGRALVVNVAREREG